MSGKTISLFLLLTLHPNAATASIVGTVLKATTLITAPLVLKHSLLAEKPATNIKDLWENCKADLPVISSNLTLYAQLVQTKVTQLQKYVAHHTQKSSSQKVFDKTEELRDQQDKAGSSEKK